MIVTSKIEHEVTDDTQITTVSQMWDAAIKHRDNGDSDKTAMQSIIESTSPLFDKPFQNLAIVISAIYADTYWRTDLQMMNKGLLAQNMNQATQLNLNDATTYANAAFLQWRGVLTRKTTNDTGTIPYPRNDYTSSVDIVCNNNFPASTNSLIDNWNSPFYQIPQVGNNFVYVRCQSTQFMGSITKLQARMFYTEAGFNAPPTSWIQLHTYATKSPFGKILLYGGESGPLDPNAQGVSEAFIFNPLDHKHVCLVATISTEFFSNKPPFWSGNKDGLTWILNNGAAVWHNEDPQISETSALKFYNQDGRPEKFAFEAHCKNVPEGTIVALNFKDSKLHNLNSGNVKIFTKHQKVATEAQLPANYTGEIEVSIHTPSGKLLPEGASVEVRMVWLLDQSHDNYLDVANLLHANVEARALRNIRAPMGSFTFLGTSK